MGNQDIQELPLLAASSHGPHILATQPQAPTQKGRRAPVTLKEQWNQGRGREGNSPENELEAETVLTITLLKHPDYKGGIQVHVDNRRLLTIKEYEC